MTYYDEDWSPRFGFGGPRNIAGIQRIVVHTTENPAGTPAANVANYQLTSASGSYHVLVDTTGHRLRENDDSWITWSTGNNAGNVQGVNLSFVAQAAWTRAQWLAQEKMLRAGATVVAHWSKTHNIPVTKVTTGRGVCGHGDLRAFGGTDHTDPGPNFPWDVFLRYVSEEVNPTPPITSSSSSKENPVKIIRSLVNSAKSFTQDTMLALIDRATWEIRVIVNELARKQGIDPDKLVADAIRKDNEK